MLGGFDDEPEFEIEARPEAEANDERFWDLSGSAELSASWNLRDHDSDTGSDYSGLQRLRQRLNLQLDVDLDDDWRLRVEGWGFADAAYRIQGRDEYTDEVLDQYEWDAELGEGWIAGKLHERIDLKLGRQVVIWGGSETLRVLDVINPLDNREPGRVDLEDLRRPLAMARIDAYAGRWTWTALLIPEIRFDENPVLGSDFFPGRVDLPEDEPRDFGDPELAAALRGTFEGWDLFFHGAWFHDDRARADGALFPTRLVHDRLWLVGAGTNATRGSWLAKTEVAFVDGLGFFGTGEKSRLDALVGAEYYGLRDTTIVLEVAHRHLFEHEAAVRAPPNSMRENQPEIALRISRSFWNERLNFTAVGVALGWVARDGAILRADLDYELLEALTVGVGVLLFQRGDLPPLDAWGRNDRALLKLRWSF